MNDNLRIERENGTYDEVNFSFRFNKLDENTALKIKELLNQYPIIFNKARNKEYYVILYEEINQDFNPKQILDIIKKFGLNDSNYGFWISFNSEYGHGGGYLPERIRKLYKEIGGQLDFSFMIGEQ